MTRARTSLLLMLGFCLVAHALGGCAPRVIRRGYTAADVKQGVSCEPRWQFQSGLGSKEAKELGRIRVVDSGFSTHCSEREVRAIVRADACGLGANVVDIQSEKQPSAVATCYHVDAKLLLLHDATQVQAMHDVERLENSRAPERVSAAKKENRALLWAAIGIGVVAGVAAGVTFTLLQ